MKSRVETLTPPNTPTPIGPYNHVAKVGEHIWIGGTAGVDPATGLLAGADVAAQTRQILKSFKVMLVPCVAHIAEIAPDGRFAAKNGDAREPVVLARTGHIRQRRVVRAGRSVASIQHGDHEEPRSGTERLRRQIAVGRPSTVAHGN